MRGNLYPNAKDALTGAAYPQAAPAVPAPRAHGIDCLASAAWHRLG